MPRVSRTAAQRYADAARKKKARSERRPAYLPPVTGQAPVELPAGLAAPQPLDFAADEALLHEEQRREEQRRAAAAARAQRAASSPAARAASRAELRHAARRAGAAPIVDYSYVRGDLRRIGIVFGVIVLALVALMFVPGLQ